MKANQSRQKSYYDKRRHPLNFEEGDHVFMRVVPTTGIGRVLKSCKLTPKFIGLYQILRKVRLLTYQIALPPLLSNLHNVLDVFQLRKYISDSSYIIDPDANQLNDNRTFETMPMRITDRSVKALRGKEIL
ncbi:PREDICTED: uncharacterized protein LOC109340680 [Lupinus angustifolius]|uniref:uncharacterized protein LOC109340680 n=1 Tax=Lupinus angustifolius TaxID=3871 RepID=UPI00092EA228|nr:PREDICTED: uncharacterized protein LOC109340680 [Lupinus angustifolius]